MNIFLHERCIRTNKSLNNLFECLWGTMKYCNFVNVRLISGKLFFIIMHLLHFSVKLMGIRNIVLYKYISLLYIW